MKRSKLNFTAMYKIYTLRSTHNASFFASIMALALKSSGNEASKQIYEKDRSFRFSILNVWCQIHRLYFDQIMQFKIGTKYVYARGHKSESNKEWKEERSRIERKRDREIEWNEIRSPNAARVI